MVVPYWKWQEDLRRNESHRFRITAHASSIECSTLSGVHIQIISLMYANKSTLTDMIRVWRLSQNSHRRQDLGVSGREDRHEQAGDPVLILFQAIEEMAGGQPGSLSERGNSGADQFSAAKVTDSLTSQFPL
jgi:hypothetical protein